MSSRPELRIDWCDIKAARYAVMHWHYSRAMPSGKLVKIGAWEDGKFIGCVLFGRGATPNLGKPYGLKQTECVELVRVAMTNHVAEISRIVRLALIFLRKSSPNLRLVISFADRSQGHHGGIYQAGNWIYNGTGTDATFYLIAGKLTHPRSIGAKGFVQNISGARKIDPYAKAVPVPGKHRYLMPLDDAMRAQIAPLAKPYPKRVKQQDAEHPSALGGVTPTHALQHREDNVPQPA